MDCVKNRLPSRRRVDQDIPKGIPLRNIPPVPRLSTPPLLIRAGLLILGLLLAASDPLLGQTRLKLSAITPGTEKVQLVYNGDFQSQQAATGGRFLPANWPGPPDVVTGAGSNSVPQNGGLIACARVDGGAAAAGVNRTLTLSANTSYVLSAYLWNLGDATNHVNTVIDMNDVSGEPQMALGSGDSEADLGYFVYRTFNTATTGTNVTLRLFYDGLTGTGAATRFYPFAAQWDNIAITRSVDFIAPQSRASGGNLRPTVRVESPVDSTTALLASTPPVLSISATAGDYDGSITNVDFFAGATRLGSTRNPPHTVLWTNPASGPCVLTAVASDNRGAATLSAPVAIVVALPRPPVSLSIARSGSNVLVSWPTQSTGLFLQSATLTGPTPPWQLLTNPTTLSAGVNQTTLPALPGQRQLRLGPDVSPFTLDRKLMMGYQGWFACPGDGSPLNRWVHWFRSQTPVATNLTVDFWPDISELDADELHATGMTLPDGSPARLYSAFSQKTVVRHFKWMKENHLDGVFLQRFSSELSSSDLLFHRDRVTDNVRVGAETHGRIFAIMYDISGQPQATLQQTLTNDWIHLITALQITNSPSYVHHNGKPVVAIWGFGFTDRTGTPQDAQIVINFFKAAGCTVMGGVPTYWRTLTGDSQVAATWAPVYRSFDIISPWAVGRYGTQAEADTFKQNLIVPDLAETRLRGIAYMPVIFPGFSWRNLTAGTLNQMPRNGGDFYWRQACNTISAGCTMIYGAMFDEMDEGTAMLKMAPTSATLPTQATLVPLNIDGRTLNSDWYLRVAGEATKMLHREIPFTNSIPIKSP